MNDLGKKLTAEKFNELIEQSGIKPKRLIADRMGFHPCNLSGLGTEKGREKIGPSIWEKLQKAVNSGDPLKIHIGKNYPMDSPIARTKSVKLPIERTGSLDLEKIANLPEKIESEIESEIEIDKEITVKINIILTINGKQIHL